MSNESEVMKALKALEERKYKTGAKVRFQDVDYNVLTFKEQIEIDLGEFHRASYLSFASHYNLNFFIYFYFYFSICLYFYVR